MKALSVILLSCLLLALMIPAQAARAQNALDAGPTGIIQTQSQIKPLANKFYQRCKANPDATLKPDEQEEYCACLSAQMYRKTLNPDERTYLATGEGAPVDYRRAIAEVYGQCISIPGRVATYHKCTTSPKAYKLVKSERNLEIMCQCVLTEMDDYWNTVAPAFLEVEMRHRKGVEDPLKFLMKGRHFPVTYAKKLSLCTARYGRRD